MKSEIKKWLGHPTIVFEEDTEGEVTRRIEIARWKVLLFLIFLVSVAAADMIFLAS